MNWNNQIICHFPSFNAQNWQFWQQVNYSDRPSVFKVERCLDIKHRKCLITADKMSFLPAEGGALTAPLWVSGRCVGLGSSAFSH